MYNAELKFTFIKVKTVQKAFPIKINLPIKLVKMGNIYAFWIK